VLLAACAPSAKEVEEFTASLTLGPTLEASLQPGPATVTSPDAYNPQQLSAEREVRIDVRIVPGLFEPTRPLGLRDRNRPQSAFDLATCQEAVRVFAAAGYQLVDASFLLDPISCPVSDLSDLKAVADQDRRGHDDTQAPHQQDEVYVVVGGAAVLDIAGQRSAVAAGSVTYVPALVPHRFVEITDDLRVIVVFSPPLTNQE